MNRTGNNQAISAKSVPAERGNSKPWYKAAHQLADGERYCTCCERDLTGHAVRMLELDQRSDTYHDFGDVPEDRSQGWFPFGLKCARNAIKRASK